MSTKRDLASIFLLALAVRLATALFISQPGYMDAAYYADGALLIAQGDGLAEPFLWNYLDDPSGLPHPGFLYWMPLPSLVAAVGAVLGADSYLGLQLPFVLLGALLPLLAYRAARAVADRFAGWVAALLTVFSGLFFPYWPLPETFAPFALCGGLALYLAGREERGGPLVWLLIGLLTGLAHLTRPDGLLLLPLVGLPLLTRGSRRRTAALALGYLAVMAPWFARNLRVVGAVLPPAGSKTLWLTTYDDLFCYRCDLSPAAYLSWGWRAIVRSKLWATGVNLQRLLAEDGLVFMLPFILVGLYRLRRRRLFALTAGYWATVFVVHSWAFTFPGPRGGFFHATAPALPFLMAAGAVGLDAAVRRAARRRRWRLSQARRIFGWAAAVGAFALSLYAAGVAIPRWNRADAVYDAVGRWLDGHDAAEAVVMVANPPAFWYHTRHRAVVVPNGDAATLLTVAGRYGVRYVLLDHNHPAPLGRLYAGEDVPSGLSVAHVWQGEGGPVVLYAVRGE